jgi:hypothetical protein
VPPERQRPVPPERRRPAPPERRRPAPPERRRPGLHWGGIFRRHCGESRGHSHLQHWRPRDTRVRVKRRPTRRQILADAFNVLPPDSCHRPESSGQANTRGWLGGQEPHEYVAVKAWLSRFAPPKLVRSAGTRIGPDFVRRPGSERTFGRCRQLRARLAPFLLGNASISHQSLPTKSDQQPAIGHGAERPLAPIPARPPGRDDANHGPLDSTCGRMSLRGGQCCPSLIINPSNVGGRKPCGAWAPCRISLHACGVEKMLKAELGIVRRQPTL